jgi:hypothetical protein
MTNNANPTDPQNTYNNYNWPTFFTTFLSIGITVLLVFFFFNTKKKFDAVKSVYSVYWKNSDTIQIKSGPNWFFYDCKADSLKSIKRIGEADKTHLLSLASTDKGKCETYNNAIDHLAFVSNIENEKNYLLILLLAGICGAIGVQLRSINNFIGVACFGKNFDFSIWWPWYILRPFIGFLIGAILFILIDGKFYGTENPDGISCSGIIAITILAGFGSEDFLDLLRKISKRIFGTDEKKEPKKKPADDPEPAANQNGGSN